MVIEKVTAAVNLGLARHNSPVRSIRDFASAKHNSRGGTTRLVKTFHLSSAGGGAWHCQDDVGPTKSEAMTFQASATCGTDSGVVLRPNSLEDWSRDWALWEFRMIEVFMFAAKRSAMAGLMADVGVHLENV